MRLAHFLLQFRKYYNYRPNQIIRKIESHNLNCQDRLKISRPTQPLSWRPIEKIETDTDF